MAALYLKIYFVGVPFFMLYNYGAAVLRAVGDTRRPLVFLVISGTVNAILNVILVVAFHLDVEGVAIATVISQMISCVQAQNVKTKVLQSSSQHRLLQQKELKYGLYQTFPLSCQKQKNVQPAHWFQAKCR